MSFGVGNEAGFQAVVKYDDLDLAFDFVSSGAPTENEAYLCRESGVIYWHSEVGDNEEDLPEDIDSDKYISIPHRNDLDLGNQLAFRFTAEVLPQRMPDVQAFFHRRGAYSRFKRMLEKEDNLQQWHEYEARAQRQALLEWCEGNGIEVSG